MRSPVAPTIADVDITLARTCDLLHKYLSTKTEIDENGFPATALTGDEDEETIEQLQKIKPLADLYRTILSVKQFISRDSINADPTWHTTQSEVLACTGAESDATIARIFREGLR